MWRRPLVITLVILVGVLLWVYTSVPYVHWDGGIELTVNVSSNCGPLRSVSCRAFSQREYALFAVETRQPESRGWYATAAPFTGEVLKVFVAVSGRDSMSGRELDRGQFRYLAVIGECLDGQQVGKIVDIPDVRLSQMVVVTLP